MHRPLGLQLDPDARPIADGPGTRRADASESRIVSRPVRAVKGVLAGEEVSPTILQSISLTINNEGYRVKQGETLDVGEIKYNLKSAPAQLDLIGKEGPTKGITLLAIAKIEGDVMTVAYNLGVLDGNADRPSDFVSDRTEHRNLVLTYQRVK